MSTLRRSPRTSVPTQPAPGTISSISTLFTATLDAETQVLLTPSTASSVPSSPGLSSLLPSTQALNAMSARAAAASKEEEEAYEPSDEQEMQTGGSDEDGSGDDEQHQRSRASSSIGGKAAAAAAAAGGKRKIENLVSSNSDDEQSAEKKAASSSSSSAAAAAASKPPGTPKKLGRWSNKEDLELCSSVLKHVTDHQGMLPGALKSGKNAPISKEWKEIAKGVTKVTGQTPDAAAKACSNRWTKVRGDLKVSTHKQTHARE